MSLLLLIFKVSSLIQVYLVLMIGQNVDGFRLGIPKNMRAISFKHCEKPHHSGPFEFHSKKKQHPNLVESFHIDMNGDHQKSRANNQPSTSHAIIEKKSQHFKILTDEPSSNNRTIEETESNSAGQLDESSIQSYWKQLYQMMRPGNFPGVVLFHLVGVHRSLSKLFRDIPNTYTLKLFLQANLQPTISATLLALLLIVSSSMLVNDYYDTRSGVDNSSSSLKPLSSGDVPLPIAKKLLSIMYGSLLLILTTLPGAPTRLLVALGTMMTFYYTKYLKPKTWWKNIVCATLMSLTPLTSGYATLNHPFVVQLAKTKGRVIDIWTSWIALGPLFCSLFCGFMGRELLMDIMDREEDREAGIRTVPVRFGRQAATKIVLLFWIGTGLFISMNPLVDLLSRVKLGNIGASFLTTANALSIRRLSLALFGGFWLSFRAWQVVKSRGEDKSLIENAIEEAKLNVLLILAASI